MPRWGARYESLDDGTFSGEIPVLPGVLANAGTLEACRAELQEPLEDWMVLGLRLGHTLPVVGGIELSYALVHSGVRSGSGSPVARA